MTYKKNSFAIISILFILLSSCSHKTVEIQGTSRFSSFEGEQNPHQFHNVVFGDTLWSISDKYYGNSLLWPDIFKNNKDRIYDADLILPGQSLIIYRNIAASSKERAIAYAKTRGLWVVGYREESDIKFLENNQ